MDDLVVRMVVAIMGFKVKSFGGGPGYPVKRGWCNSSVATALMRNA